MEWIESLVSCIGRENGEKTFDLFLFEENVIGTFSCLKIF